MNDPFCSMSIGSPIPEIWLFKNLTMKVQYEYLPMHNFSVWNWNINYAFLSMDLFDTAHILCTSVLVYQLIKLLVLFVNAWLFSWYTHHTHTYTYLRYVKIFFIYIWIIYILTNPNWFNIGCYDWCVWYCSYDILLKRNRNKSQWTV